MLACRASFTLVHMSPECDLKALDRGFLHQPLLSMTGFVNHLSVACQCHPSMSCAAALHVEFTVAGCFWGARNLGQALQC